LDPPPEGLPLLVRNGRPRPRSRKEEVRDLRVTLAGRGHGLHDVAVVGRVVVSEEADEPAVPAVSREAGRFVGGGGGPEGQGGAAVGSSAVGQEKAPALVHRERAGPL